MPNLRRSAAGATLTVIGLCCALSLPASGTSSPSGGELRVVSASDVDSLDPALVSEPLSWDIATTTCSTLFTTTNDQHVPRLVPEAATTFPSVSPDGLTYTFEIRSGLRFADGSALTAAAYSRAIGRVLDPRMQAPAVSQFASAIADAHAHGRRLTLHLTHRRGDLLALLTMPWACPVPAGLPIDPAGAGPIPGSGPYAIAVYQPGREILLRRNPFYRGPRQDRSASILIAIGGTPDADVQQVENGTADLDLDLSLPSLQPPPPQLLTDLASRYGIGKHQFFIRPLDGTVFLALNCSRPLFRDNAPLRRAINYALDRPEIVRQGGPLVGHRTDQLLPPATLGYRDSSLYPLAGPELRVARRLARGHLRAGNAVLYVADVPVALRRAAIIQYDLGQIGVHVQVRAFARALLITKIATRGEPYDLALTGWTGFTPDPQDFLLRLLDGHTITAGDNFDVSYFNVASVNRRLEADNTLPAPQRYEAFATSETNILRRYAPVAPIMNQLGYVLISARVHCFTYNYFGGFDLGSACLK
jgi:peptide/nickel transport system substrate-binding protein